MLQCAIKFIERTEVAKHHKHVRREVVNHSSLLHPHVRPGASLSLTTLALHDRIQTALLAFSVETSLPGYVCQAVQ